MKCDASLDDLSPMPFGKYKGRLMQDVPADYLFWLWTHGLEHESGPVAEYIRDNISSLSLEYPDGQW